MASDATERGREREREENETGAATMEKLRREEGKGRKKIQEEGERGEGDAMMRRLSEMGI